MLGVQRVGEPPELGARDVADHDRAPLDAIAFPRACNAMMRERTRVEIEGRSVGRFGARTTRNECGEREADDRSTHTHPIRKLIALGLVRCSKPSTLSVEPLPDSFHPVHGSAGSSASQRFM